ncbi:MAG: NUDIX domain-containing protein [Bacteroidota bacterium]
MKHQLRVTARALMGDAQRIVMCWEKEHQFYFLPGGTLDPGERLQACLVRELREEMNFEAHIEDFVGCIENPWQGHDYIFQEFTFVFRVRTPSAWLNGPIASNEPHIAFEVLPLKALHQRDNIMPPQLKVLLAQHYHQTSAYVPAL